MQIITYTLNPDKFLVYFRKPNKDLCWLTSEELDFYDEQERIWRDQQKDYTPLELAEIFPESKHLLLRSLNKKVKENRLKVQKLNEDIIETNNKRHRAPEDQKWIYNHTTDNMKETVKDLEKEIKRDVFFISAIKNNRPQGEDKITVQDIARAKEFPIDGLYIGHLYKHGNTLTGLCPFHLEKSASFTIYKKTNRFYCFGCNAGTDAIDFVKKQRNCEFLEAVKIILNK